MIPTISQIADAARASSRRSPRPCHAFWLVASTLILDPDPEGRGEGSPIAAAFCEAHGWSLDGVAPLRVALDRLSVAGEADLRAAFVELSILASPNEDAARAMWAEALGINEHSAKPHACPACHEPDDKEHQ